MTDVCHCGYVLPFNVQQQRQSRCNANVGSLYCTLLYSTPLYSTLLYSTSWPAPPRAGERRVPARDPSVRETGGAPRSADPRSHFLVRIAKSPGCHCTDAFGGKTNIVECRHLLGALPLSLDRLPPIRRASAPA